MKTLGICIGATTLQCVTLLIDSEIVSVEKFLRISHDGNPQKTLLEFLENNPDVCEIDRIALTGRLFRSNILLSSISEPEALEYALKKEYPKKNYPQAVVSFGGETLIAYKIGDDGEIISVHSGNKCASGTGDFFLQQIKRMGLSIDEAVILAEKGNPKKIAGRCSVFCKSDCTHSLNKGEPVENIAAGLCVMMADKVKDLVGDNPDCKIAVIGGGVLNNAMINNLKKYYHRVDICELSSTFEAYGAALWASSHECITLPLNINDVFGKKTHTFSNHTSLNDFKNLVVFKNEERALVKPNDTCIVGLDVGSTTTKAVLMRKTDKKILGSVYLRTNGNPIEASRKCYFILKNQLGDIPVKIIGLGVTGSGRQLAGLHALTDNIINEITAHANAAYHYDPLCDTIFEIGGQDAKYTYLTNGIPSDYAMNEACSAGTGSFLEESAFETLNIKTEEIGALALQGDNPPNFTDQCAAFIASDIKRAVQEGFSKNNILAGLVYSICLNYLDRVKGSRPIGKKIFMQGGVCYNKSVPVAMAGLIKSEIIVPPEPGLTGALGAALEVNKRIDLGFTEASDFNLDELSGRNAVKKEEFICAGGKEKCDRHCIISRIQINNKIYPFGGICDKYYNVRKNKNFNSNTCNLVDFRNKLLFEKYSPKNIVSLPEKTVGLCRSFLTYQLYPLYSNFFADIGFKVILAEESDAKGISRAESSFCLPAEIGHKSFLDLLKKKVDYIFLPQVMQVPVPNVPTYSRTCVFVQAEPYYLKSTFRKEIEESLTTVLSPVLKMEKGYIHSIDTFIDMAFKLGVKKDIARKAYMHACTQQNMFEQELKEKGKEVINYLDNNPDQTGIVLFGRPYNSFADKINMGIPNKVASRGIFIIPFDMIPADNFSVDYKMFWAMGQKIMKSAGFIKTKRNIFGFFITNFSCGPDSFLLGFFRNLMGEKPSLTLELDQHTADAGIDTRIEAALDIMNSHLKSEKKSIQEQTYTPAQIIYSKNPTIISSEGKSYSIKDPRVEIILPSMGKFGTEILAAVFKSIGIKAKALPVADEDVLLEGKKNSLCKECLPYMLTTGSFLRYLKSKKEPDVVTLLFMATGGGPCRLGQYSRALDQLLNKHKIKNAAVFTMTDENSYAGLGSRNQLKAWQAILTADIFSDIKSTISIAAKNKTEADEILNKEWERVISYFRGDSTGNLTNMLISVAGNLSKIHLSKSINDIPVISLIGEIFVRKDEFSRKNIIEYMEKYGFIVKVAPVSEFLYYGNYVIDNMLGERKFSIIEHAKMRITHKIQEWWENKIKSIFSKSGAYHLELVHVAETINGIENLVNENLRGETILTIGLGLREILNPSCGVISIGPFGCMPSRVAEAVLKKEMNVNGIRRIPLWEKKINGLENINNLPFLAIETDGNPFPQVIDANLEAFVLRAKRVHQELIKLKRQKNYGNISRKSFVSAYSK